MNPPIFSDALITGHAAAQLRERGIEEKIIRQALSQPDSVVPVGIAR
jgi:hypothetical protein